MSLIAAADRQASVIDYFSLAVAPDKLTVSGASEANVGDSVAIECTTANSNPKAGIRWIVDGVEKNAAFTYSV